MKEPAQCWELGTERGNVGFGQGLLLELSGRSATRGSKMCMGVGNWRGNASVPGLHNHTEMEKPGNQRDCPIPYRERGVELRFLKVLAQRTEAAHGRRLHSP